MQFDAAELRPYISGEFGCGPKLERRLDLPVIENVGHRHDGITFALLKIFPHRSREPIARALLSAACLRSTLLKWHSFPVLTQNAILWPFPPRGALREDFRACGPLG